MSLVPESRCEFGRGWGGGYPSFDKLFNLRPDLRIAFDRRVPLEENPVVPWIGATLSRLLVVFEPQIAKDGSARGIGSNDHRAAVNNAFALVEIYSFVDVGRNNGIVLVMFADAVDLYRERNWHTLPL